ncbi:hypothetical protein [Candidatus Hakubella thermalkaliphila]|uniref:hypothetical protein n=1 Tax=Candidatus Hakubella thermalkaliphila TaxID=2754717 RepID=UPI001C614502|nr:hypothetical protein [Candidatus Hakubella thermalkaliphila]
MDYLKRAVLKYPWYPGMDASVNRALHSILGGIVQGEMPWEGYRGWPQRLQAMAGLI